MRLARRKRTRRGVASLSISRRRPCLLHRRSIPGEVVATASNGTSCAPAWLQPTHRRHSGDVRRGGQAGETSDLRAYLRAGSALSPKLDAPWTAPADPRPKMGGVPRAQGSPTRKSDVHAAALVPQPTETERAFQMTSSNSSHSQCAPYGCRQRQRALLSFRM